MGIALGTERTNLPPVVRLNAIGATFTGAVIDISQRERQRKTATGWEPVTKRDGRPQKEQIVTYLVVAGDAEVGLGEDQTRPVVPGETVRVIYRGKTWGSLIEANRELTGAEEVGDVHNIRVIGAVGVNDAGIIPGTECTTQEQVVALRMKGRNVSFDWQVRTRRAKPEEAEQTRQCEQAYHAARLQHVELTLPSPTTAAPANPWGDTEDPF